ncbi:hypothetical protein HDU78_005406 [Chytriomyces hyalinus]|nr:hypothetical protein HDU78_005406 [Chytriomyces hyalinus]
MLRRLNSKEASYLASAPEFTNFGFAFAVKTTSATARVRLTQAATSALNEVVERHVMMRATVVLDNAALAFKEGGTVALEVAEGVSLERVAESAIATPMNTAASLAHLWLVFNDTNSEEDSDFAVVFTFAHCAFDAMCASSICFDWIKFLNANLQNVTIHLSPVSNQLSDKIFNVPIDMIPAKQKTWAAFIPFILHIIWLYMFMAFAKPATLQRAKIDSVDGVRSLFNNVFLESAKNAQLTRLFTRTLSKDETARVIQRAKSINTSVTGLICGAMSAALASERLLLDPKTSVKNSSKSTSTKKRQFSFLAGLSVNGRPGLDISPTEPGAYNYSLLIPHTSVTAVSDKSVSVEAAVQSSRAALELTTRLRRDEPVQLARFLTPYDYFKHPLGNPSALKPALYALPDLRAEKKRLPLAFTLSNLGSFTCNVAGEEAEGTGNIKEVLSVEGFRLLSTMRHDACTTRVEMHVVSLNKCMSITMSVLNEMVDPDNLQLLQSRFYTGLLGE